MAIGAYKALYGSSVVFGVRKQLQVEQGVTELEQQIAELERAEEGERKSRPRAAEPCGGD